MFCTADPASGSVMPMLIRASPSAAAGSQRSFMASGPRCSMPRGGPLKVSWQQMADDTSARAISSSTMEASTSPSPCRPTLPDRDAQQVGTRPGPCAPRGDLARSRRPVTPGAPPRGSATSRASWRSAAWSSLSASRSTPDAGPRSAHQSPSSVPTMPTKLTPSPGARPGCGSARASGPGRPWRSGGRAAPRRAAGASTRRACAVPRRRSGARSS
jgi:hypothetical protein